MPTRPDLFRRRLPLVSPHRWSELPGVLLTLACLLLAGCPGTPSPESEPTNALPYRGVHLRFVVPRSLQLAQRWAPAINDWADENEASVEVVEADLHAPPAQWIDQLTTGPTSLVLLPTVQLGELLGAGLAATIPGDVDAPPPTWPQAPTPLRAAVSTLGTAEGFVVATSPTPVVAIRSDLLQVAGRTLPATWAEYDRLVAEREQWAPNRTAVEPRDTASVASLFLARALSAAKHPAQLSVELDVSTGDPLIASEPYVRTLAELQALTPHLDENVRSMSPSDCAQALADGSAAIGIVWASAGDVPLPTKPAADTDAALTFLPLPGRSEVYDREDQAWTEPNGGEINRPALCGMAGYSVAVTNVETGHEQAASWDLWGLLARYQSEETIAPLPGTAMLGPTPAGDDLLDGLSPAETRSYTEAQTANLHNTLLVCELPMRGRTRLRDALTSALERALDEEADPAAALQQAQEEWTRIIDEIGRTNVLNSYRVRQGLIPLPE